MISFLGFVYSFYYAIQYALWLFVSACIGYTLVIYSNGVLAKYQNNEKRYKEIMDITKRFGKVSSHCFTYTYFKGVVYLQVNYSRGRTLF